MRQMASRDQLFQIRPSLYPILLQAVPHPDLAKPLDFEAIMIPKTAWMPTVTPNGSTWVRATVCEPAPMPTLEKSCNESFLLRLPALYR